MESIVNVIDYLSWQLGPIVDFALKNWAITFVSLLLMIRWAGNERRRIKQV